MRRGDLPHRHRPGARDGPRPPRDDSSRAHRPTRASSTSRPSARSPTRWAPSSWSTWPTSRASWPPASTRRRWGSRTSSPPRSTRPSAAARGMILSSEELATNVARGLPRAPGHLLMQRDRGQGGRPWATRSPPSSGAARSSGPQLPCLAEALRRAPDHVSGGTDNRLCGSTPRRRIAARGGNDVVFGRGGATSSRGPARPRLRPARGPTGLGTPRAAARADAARRARRRRPARRRGARRPLEAPAAHGPSASASGTSRLPATSGGARGPAQAAGSAAFRTHVRTLLWNRFGSAGACSLRPGP